jgi:tRNA(fMet)-specific endonuclease VapC
MFILDTDHISLFQRNHPTIVANVLETLPDKLATTVITLEEQIRGRLDRIRKAKSDEEIVRAYKNLFLTFLFFKISESSVLTRKHRQFLEVFVRIEYVSAHKI